MKQIVVLLCAFFLFSCAGHNKHKLNTSVPLTKGQLVYDVYGDVGGWGWKFSFEFDSANVRINQKYALTASETKIIDIAADEVLNLDNELRLNWKLKDSFFTYSTIKEMVKGARSTTYGDTVKTVNQEYKDILGYKCQKVVLELGKQVVMTFWTTDKIKTGIILPGTPLALEHVALELEIDNFGTIRNYRIKSINNLSVTENYFEHIVPDKYNLIVPASVYSIRQNFAKENVKSKYASLQYPTYPNGNEAVKQYIRNELDGILGKHSFEKLTYSIEIIVGKDGKVKKASVFNYSGADDNDKLIKEMLLNMPTWIPGQVRGRPVNSAITIII